MTSNLNHWRRHIPYLKSEIPHTHYRLFFFWSIHKLSKSIYELSWRFWDILLLTHKWMRGVYTFELSKIFKCKDQLELGSNTHVFADINIFIIFRKVNFTIQVRHGIKAPDKLFYLVLSKLHWKTFSCPYGLPTSFPKLYRTPSGNHRLNFITIIAVFVLMAFTV